MGAHVTSPIAHTRESPAVVSPSSNIVLTPSRTGTVPMPQLLLSSKTTISTVPAGARASLANILGTTSTQTTAEAQYIYSPAKPDPTLPAHNLLPIHNEAVDNEGTGERTPSRAHLRQKGRRTNPPLTGASDRKRQWVQKKTIM